MFPTTVIANTCNSSLCYGDISSWYNFNQQNVIEKFCDIKLRQIALSGIMKKPKIYNSHVQLATATYVADT